MDSNKQKMHMKNNKQHKTRKHQDQTRGLIKNNLKIMKNTMNAWDFRKMQENFFKSMQLTPNLKIDSRLKQETQNIFGFYDFMIFFVFLLFFFENIFGKTKNKRKIFEKDF